MQLLKKFLFSTPFLESKLKLLPCFFFLNISIGLSIASADDTFCGPRQPGSPLLSREVSGFALAIQYSQYTCIALSASAKIYDFSDGELFSVGDPFIISPWIDCEWVEKTLIPEAEIFEKKHSLKDGKKEFWWNSFINACKAYPSPAGYKISKMYLGLKGAQLALFSSLDGMPPILSFAGSQNSTDRDTWLQGGLPQLKEVIRFRSSFDEKAPWYFLSDRSASSDINLNVKFRPITSEYSETLIYYLAKMLADKKDIIITGHSLGGALAQIMAYLLEAEAQKFSKERGKVHLYTWNSLGGKESLNSLLKEIKWDFDKDVLNNIDIANYAVEGDLTPMLKAQLGDKVITIPNKEPKSLLGSILPKTKIDKYHSIKLIEELFRPAHCP